MTQKPAALDFRGSVFHVTIEEPTGATSSITTKILLTRRMLLQRIDQDPSLTHIFYSKEMIKIRAVKYFPMKKLGLVFRDVCYCTRHGRCVWIGGDDGSRERTREGPFSINFNCALRHFTTNKEDASTANL
jgi:hypothetical protein